MRESSKTRTHSNTLHQAVAAADASLVSGDEAAALDVYLSVARLIDPHVDATEWLRLLIDKIKPLHDGEKSSAVLMLRAKQIVHVLLLSRKFKQVALISHLMIENFPDDAEWQGRAAFYLYHFGERNGALLQARKVLRRWPEQDFALIVQGIDMRARGLYEEAVVHMRKVTEISPANREGWIILGLLYSVLAQHTKSIETLRHGIRQLPNDAYLINYLGLCCRWAGLYEEELDVFRAAAIADHNDKWAYHNMLWLFLHAPGPFVKETFAELGG